MGQQKARIGLLSNTERQLVEDYKNLKKLRNQHDRLKSNSPSHPKIKELSKRIKAISSGYSALPGKLKDRIESVNDDLRIILNNEKLVRDLKLFGLSSFIGITVKLKQLKAPTFQEVSEDADLSGYSTWRVFVEKEDRKRKYWLSTTEEKKSTARDTDTPYYPIRGIKGIYPTKLIVEKNGKEIEVQKIINVKKILYEALDLMKRFPESKIIDKPRTIKDIWIRIEKFKKKRREQNQPKIEQISLADIPKEDRHEIIYLPTKPKKKESEEERMLYVRRQREEFDRKFENQELYGQKNYKNPKI